MADPSTSPPSRFHSGHSFRPEKLSQVDLFLLVSCLCSNFLKDAPAPQTSTSDQQLWGLQAITVLYIRIDNVVQLLSKYLHAFLTTSTMYVYSREKPVGRRMSVRNGKDTKAVALVIMTSKMLRMAIDIGEGVWEERGLPKGKVHTAEHLTLCRDILTNTYIPQAFTDFILHLNKGTGPSSVGDPDPDPHGYASN